MQCPTCVEDGERSTVRARNPAVTAMAWEPYYDEDGRYHAHDPNHRADFYECSRGHTWSVPRRCWCGWPEKRVE